MKKRDAGRLQLVFLYLTVQRELRFSLLVFRKTLISLGHMPVPLLITISWGIENCGLNSLIHAFRDGWIMIIDSSTRNIWREKRWSPKGSDRVDQKCSPLNKLPYWWEKKGLISEDVYQVGRKYYHSFSLPLFRLSPLLSRLYLLSKVFSWVILVKPHFTEKSFYFCISLWQTLINEILAETLWWF